MASLLSSAFSALAPAGVKMAVAIGKTAVDLAKDAGSAAVGSIKNKNILIPDRKSTRLNSSHGYISYAVFCLKKKKKQKKKKKKNETRKYENAPENSSTESHHKVTPNYETASAALCALQSI